MRFEEIIQSLLEKEDNQKDVEHLPWSIEITKDPKRGEVYNELGDLIIRLFEFRAKL